jgi:uncharacterized protein (DUF1778 family)
VAGHGEASKEQGKETNHMSHIPKSRHKTRFLRIRITADEERAIKRAARTARQSVTELVRARLADALCQPAEKI